MNVSKIEPAHPTNLSHQVTLAWQQHGYCPPYRTQRNLTNACDRATEASLSLLPHTSRDRIKASSLLVTPHEHTARQGRHSLGPWIPQTSCTDPYLCVITCMSRTNSQLQYLGLTALVTCQTLNPPFTIPTHQNHITGLLILRKPEGYRQEQKKPQRHVSICT